jgi:hypothetical protein
MAGFQSGPSNLLLFGALHDCGAHSAVSVAKAVRRVHIGVSLDPFS